jgi:hypothetical protein
MGFSSQGFAMGLRSGSFGFGHWLRALEGFAVKQADQAPL